MYSWPTNPEKGELFPESVRLLSAHAKRLGRAGGRAVGRFSKCSDTLGALGPKHTQRDNERAKRDNEPGYETR